MTIGGGSPLRSAAWKRFSPSPRRCSTLRLAGLLASRCGTRREPQLLAWSAGLAAYALGAAAIAWGAAGGWNEGVFRAYYLCGGLLTAALLGAGSLLGVGVRAAGPVALVYAGLAAGVALAVPLTERSPAPPSPKRRSTSSLFPARVLAIVGNVAGSLALIGVALAGLRRRPVGNVLLLAGFAVAAAGSALAGLGAAQTAVFIALGAGLLYAGTSPGRSKTYRLQTNSLLACARNRRAVRVPLRLFRTRTADRVPEQGELCENPIRAPVRASGRTFPRRGRVPAAECSVRVLDAGRATGADRRVSGRDLALAVLDAQATDAHELSRAEGRRREVPRADPRPLASAGRAPPSTRPRIRRTAALGSASTATSAVPRRGGARGPATATTAGCRWTSASSASTAPSSCAGRARRTAGRRSSRCGSPSARTEAGAASTRGRTRLVTAA